MSLLSSDTTITLSYPASVDSTGDTICCLLGLHTAHRMDFIVGVSRCGGGTVAAKLALLSSVIVIC